ncbi:hypothetical protein AAC387_Pa05g0297 [Persea americana]
MGSAVLAPFRASENSHRHLKLMGDLGQIVPMKYNPRDDNLGIIGLPLFLPLIGNGSTKIQLVYVVGVVAAIVVALKDMAQVLGRSMNLGGRGLRSKLRKNKDIDAKDIDAP